MPRRLTDFLFEDLPTNSIGLRFDFYHVPNVGNRLILVQFTKSVLLFSCLSGSRQDLSHLGPGEQLCLSLTFRKGFEFRLLVLSPNDFIPITLWLYRYYKFCSYEKGLAVNGNVVGTFSHCSYIYCTRVIPFWITIVHPFYETARVTLASHLKQVKSQLIQNRV